MSFPTELSVLVPVYLASKDGAEALVVDKQAAVKAGMRVTYELAAPGRHKFEFALGPDKACYVGFLQEVSMSDIDTMRKLGALDEPKATTTQPQQPTTT